MGVSVAALAAVLPRHHSLHCFEDTSMNDGKDRAEVRARKKPYRKPEFRFERVFETRALTCGKVQQTQGSCAHNRKSS